MCFLYSLFYLRIRLISFYNLSDCCSLPGVYARRIGPPKSIVDDWFKESVLIFVMDISGKSGPGTARGIFVIASLSNFRREDILVRSLKGLSVGLMEFYKVRTDIFVIN